MRGTSSREAAKIITLDGTTLTLRDIKTLVSNLRATVRVTPKALVSMQKTRMRVLSQMTRQPIYGVNTGFGPMVNRIINEEHLTDLQYNLVRGHAVGIGEAIDSTHVFAAMLVRLNTILRGASGASPALAKALTELINARIAPIVPEHGAVGTSGDLVQLAHIALALIGEGEVLHAGKRKSAAEALRTAGIAPYELGPKEGLSLINGTSMMSGIGALLVCDAERTIDIAVRTGVCALELVRGFSDILDESLHRLRPHRGQLHIVRAMRDLLADSRRIREREQLQDKIRIRKETYTTDVILQEVYSMRCIPQILGPMYDAVQTARATIETEVNSVTDNPVIDRSGRFLHGGNFHGDYVATAIDHMKIGMVKLALLTERRINFFLNKNVNGGTFPPFLNLKEAGLSMGLQGLQFVGTSTAAYSQSLGYPHSLHTISTNGDNQDIVSMGTDAALIAAKVIENAYTLLAIECVTLSQAAETLKTGERRRMSRASRDLISRVRKYVRPVVDDRPLSEELNALREALKHSHVFETNN
ncbi:aromatic amino acid lyase [Candidatus Kaiserbacteria bacterium]|nr:aromatic amino acid lyase [Candidatus Kaiserbacteria bacterium]